MKKHGFTLAEILIAIGVVGIIAAITAPAINNIMPDKNKAKVLKAYKTASDITSTLLSDPGFYYGQSDSEPSLKCVGLACDARPLVQNFRSSTYSESNKFAHLFYKQLDTIKEDDLTESERTSYPISVAAINAVPNISFLTRDGLYWRFEAPVYTMVGTGENRYRTATIGFKIDTTADHASDNNDCSFHPENHPKPTQFKFTVNNNGTIVGDDELTKVFLERKAKLTGVKEDYRIARIRWNEANEDHDRLQKNQ